MADNGETFKAILQVLDEATKPLREIQNQVKAVQESVKRLAHEEDEAKKKASVWSEVSGHVKTLHSHFGTLNTKIGEIGKSIAQLFPALGAIGAGGSLVGLFELTDRVAEARAQFLKTATEIGILPAQLSALNFAAKMTAVSLDTMQGGLVKLDKAMALAASGKNKDAALIFQHMHIALRNADGSVKKIGDVMPQIAESFRRTTDPTLRVAMAMALFGKAGAEMIPMLVEGKAGLEEFAETARKVNYAPSKQEAEDLAEYHRNMMFMTSAVGGLTNEIGANVAGPLKEIVKAVGDWVAANRDWIATGIAKKVTELADAVKDILPHIHSAHDAWVELGVKLKELASNHRELFGVLGGSGLLMASPIITAAASAVAALKTIGTALSTLRLLFLTNPLGIIVTAIAAIGFGAYEAYQHWDEVKAWFAGDAKILSDEWQLFSKDMKTVWDDVAGFFEGGWSRIKPVVEELAQPMKWLGEHLNFAGGGPAPSPADPSPAAAGSGPAWAGSDNPWAIMHTPLPIGRGYGRGDDAPADRLPRQDSQVHVRVQFDNAPPGTKVDTTAAGNVGQVQTDVGYNLTGLFGAASY